MRKLKDRLQWQAQKYLNAHIVNDNPNGPFPDYVEFTTNDFQNTRFAPFNQVDININIRAATLLRTPSEIENRVLIKYQLTIIDQNTNKVVKRDHWIDTVNMTDTLNSILDANSRFHHQIDAWAQTQKQTN